MARREVRRSNLFLEHAHELFPPGGSAEGSPSFELFESGPLRGVEELFSRALADQPEAAAGIHFALLAPVPAFPAMVIYACLGTDGVVELLDIEIDHDYYDLIGDDPTE